MRAIFEAVGEIELAEVGGFVAGEPVAGSAEQVVAGFGVFNHVEGFDEVAEPEGDRNIDIARG